jgi:hypothetical protein
VHALWPERFATVTAAKKAVRRGEFVVDCNDGQVPRVHKCQFQCKGGELVEWRPRVTSAQRMDPHEVRRPITQSPPPSAPSTPTTGRDFGW